MKLQKPTDAARLIKTCRLEQKLTQQDVAATVGITRQSFARIEQGHEGASLNTYLKIFATLGISLTGTPTATEVAASIPTTNVRWKVPADSSQHDALRRLANTLSHTARQDLFDSGALTDSMLRMSQSVLDSLPHVDPSAPKNIAAGLRQFTDNIGEDARGSGESSDDS